MVQLVLNTPSFESICFDGDGLPGSWQTPIQRDTGRSAYICHKPRHGRAALAAAVPAGGLREARIDHDELSGPGAAPGVATGVKGDETPAQPDLGGCQAGSRRFGAEGGQEIGRGGHHLGGRRVQPLGRGGQDGVGGAEHLTDRPWRAVHRAFPTLGGAGRSGTSILLTVSVTRSPGGLRARPARPGER